MELVFMETLIFLTYSLVGFSGSGLSFLKQARASKIHRALCSLTLWGNFRMKHLLM